MPLWGNQDLSSNTPKTMQLATFNANQANGPALWHNTTPNSFNKGMIEGLYGVTEGMLGVTDPGAGTKATKSPGWILVKQGTGSVANVVLTSNVVGSYIITNGGATYSNLDVFVIEETHAINAVANLITNSTGGVTSLNFTANGLNFSNIGSLGFVVANSSDQTTSNTSNGTGLVVTVGLVNVVGPTGNGFSNTELFVVSNGSSNAVGNLVTTNTGAISTINFSSIGSGFVNLSSVVVSFANSSDITTTNTANGTFANYTLNLGGRAGRISAENLVVLSSMTSTSSTGLFPNT